MNKLKYAQRLAWPAALLALSSGLAFFRPHLIGIFGQGETLSFAISALTYFAIAWLVSRILGLMLDQTSNRHQPYPRLLKDLIAALLFMVAFSATISLLMGEGVIGALAGSGLIIAMLGFAIRNVVADTLSGIALGIEGPFRIGDWIEIDGILRGRVIEIGWRTTRILTPDATYMILPNSEIARERLTNYSAPKKQYRVQITMMLDHFMPVRQAREIMLGAIRQATLIQQEPSPDVRVIAYEEGGVKYAIRYWVSGFERDADCRDEVYSLVDDALRNAGYTPHRRIELVQPDAFSGVASAAYPANPALPNKPDQA